MLDLCKAAMLIKPRIELRGLLGERKDSGATAHVETTYDVAERRAKVGKFLISPKAKTVKAVRAAAQNLRETVYRYTSPWLESDLRVLAAKAHPDFATDWQAGQRRFQNVIEDYMADYPYLVRDSERELGALFDANQYPTADKVRGLFRCNLDYLPFPSAGNFVADIANDAADEARRSVESKVNDVLDSAFNDIVSKSEKVVASYVEKLAAAQNANEGDKVIFRDSLVDNVADLSQLIRKLNFTDDTRLETVAVQLHRLSQTCAQSLRSIPDLRQEGINAGKALLSKLDAMKLTDSQVDSFMTSGAAEYV